MKTCLFAWFFFLSSTLFALYNGNPSAPALLEEGFFFCKENGFSVRAGYQRDWEFDRNMKAVSKVSGRMDNFSYVTDQGVLIFNLINRLEVYGSAGASRFNLTHIPLQGIRNEYETHTQFTWCLGLKGIICTWDNLSLGADFKYSRSQPTIRWMAVNGVPVQPSSGSKLNFHEWQFGLGLSYIVGIFIPYLTVKYSNATGSLKHLPPGFLPGTRHFDMKNRRKFGMALGCTLSNKNRFAVTIETRMIDEQAITLAGEVKF